MICSRCQLLTLALGCWILKQDEGVNYETYEGRPGMVLHSSLQSLRKSARKHCHICSFVLLKIFGKSTRRLIDTDAIKIGVYKYEYFEKDCEYEQLRWGGGELVVTWKERRACLGLRFMDLPCKFDCKYFWE
jgi:hypothetical protein